LLGKIRGGQKKNFNIEDRGCGQKKKKKDLANVL